MGKRILKILAALVFLGAAAFAAYETLKVREIAVIGCVTKKAEDIAGISRIEYGESVFLLDRRAVLDRLSQEPFIKPLSVEIEYPDKVVITIEERLRAACIEKQGVLLIIDKEGWLLEVKVMPQDIEYTLITGVPADAAEVGKRLGTSDTFKLDVLSRVITALEENGLYAQGIDISLAASVAVDLRGGMKIELGDDTRLDEKMKWIKASLASLREKGIEEGILDVSTAKYAYHRVK